MPNFIKSVSTYATSTQVQAKMRKILCEILGNNGGSQYDTIFEFGSHLDEFGKMIRQMVKFRHFIGSDICDFGLKSDEKITHRIIDMNYFDYDIKADLIISNACLQWLNGTEILSKISQSLNPNGEILISTFGERNFSQIRELTGVGLDYPSILDLRNALRNFKEINISEEIIDLHFGSPIELLRHIKHSGVGGMGRVFVGKKMLKNLSEIYANTLTYHPVYIYAKI